MPVTLHVKCEDGAAKLERETWARRVLDYFGTCLPISRLLCFLDDEDPSTLKGERGAANRGLYGPIHDNTPMADWPDYVKDHIFVDDGVHFWFQRIIDGLVYLYGSTCSNQLGLTMTLAHELQHAIQHENVRHLWAVNGLISQLPRETIVALKLSWADIPIEREARIVSKRVAVHLFGEKRVEEYIDQKIAERVTEADAADWQFVRTLTRSSSVNLADETTRLFARLRNQKAEFEALLQEKKSAINPDFMDIGIDEFFSKG